MAEVSFASSSAAELEKFQDRNDSFSSKNLSDCLDFCSMTSAPKNSSSWAEDGSVLGADSLDNAANLQSRLDSIVTQCFANVSGPTSGNESGSNSVHIRQQEEHLHENELWEKITRNFGNVLPINWCATYAKQLQEKSLEIKQTRQASQSSELDISDDEELQQSFDLHSLIISSLHQEPMFTADEVISEIEGMLEDSPPVTANDMEIFTPELLKFKARSLELGKSLQNNLDTCSVRDLSELYDELDATVRDYSEVLIQQLALREELGYEKELMNQFISLHVNIQKKKRELQTEQKRGLTPTEASISISSLTTQIPFYPTAEPISAELLQVYVKLLEAMDSENPNLPTILTDYILKVVCPTS